MTSYENTLAESIALDGEWSFELAGEQGAIHVPGAWEAQGWPRRVAGPAVYTRQVDVPQAWQGRVVQLQFDAASTHAEIAVNGRVVGEHRGMWTPFAVDVSEHLHYGAANGLRVTVTKPGGDDTPLRESLAGFLPDVMLPFGGLWQGVRLVAFDCALSAVTLRAAFESGAVYLTADVLSGEDLTARVVVRHPNGATVEHPAQIERGQLKAAFVVSDFEAWSPARPALYTATITLERDGVAQAEVTRTFGFRRLDTAGDQLRLNGAAVFLRGALNWGWYPEILCPAPDEASIRAEFRQVRELGFNLIKLCLYVPHERYFEIADEEGMLLWLELPLWLPQVTARLRDQAPAEYAAIMQRVQHHPAVVIVSLGCELNATVDAELLGALNTAVQPYMQDALLCDNSGSGEAYGGLSFDFADFNDYHFYADLQYFDPLVDHFSRDWRPARPWIFGEFCDADDFRDLDEIAAAHGGVLPWWLAEQNPLHPLTFIAYPQQQARMAALDLGGFTPQDVQRISRQQSLFFRKTILEKVRARAGMGGYVVTSLRDTPLATSGLLDDLGRIKHDAAAFRAFNADSVLLIQRSRARRWTHGGDRPAPLDPRCFTSGEQVSLDVILAQVGAEREGGTLEWAFMGQAHTVDVPGGLKLLRQITLDMPEVSRPETHMLTVRLGAVTNQWPLHVFPKIEAWPEGVALREGLGVRLDDLRDVRAESPRVLVTSVLDDRVRAHLAGGGRALLLQTGESALPAVALPFWREAIRLIYPHPVMDDFPHADFAPFYALATDHALRADLPGARPIIRRLDARQFTFSDYLVALEGGRLIATTLNFQGGMGDQPLSLRDNPAGRWLLWRLLSYLDEQPPQ